MAFIPETSYGIQGQLVQWTRNAKNLGSSTSNQVRMTLNIPNILGYVSHNVSKGSYNPTTKVWTIGSLTPNEQATINIYFLTNSAPDSNITLLSSLTGTGIDSNPSNNSNTDTLVYDPIATLNEEFRVNEETAYISNYRNLNNSIGVPVVGDISKVFNPNSTGFTWNTINNGLFSNVYFFKGSYGTVPLTNKKVEAGFSDFETLTLDGTKIIDVNNVSNTLNIKNKSTATLNRISGKTVFNGTGGTLKIDDLGGFIEMSGTCSGKFIVEADTVTNAVTLKENSVTPPTYGVYTTIDINIKTLDNFLIISNINLSGINLRINIESTGEKGKLRFDGITVNNSTNITVSGNFYESGNVVEFYTYPEIELVSSTAAEEDFTNRINIINSSFFTSASRAVLAAEDTVGFSINTSQFRTSGVQVIEAQSPIFISNSVTNDTHAYGTDPNIFGSIIQDLNL